MALFNDIVDFLTPYVMTEEQQRTLVESAFYGQRLLQYVRWGETGYAFSVQIVRHLLDYGEIEIGKQAIIVLLEQLKLQIGKDKQRQADEFIAQMQKQSTQQNHDEFNNDTLPSATIETIYRHIFISYSSIDRAFTSRLATDLRANHYPVWIDNVSIKYEGIRVGEDWKQSLANAIQIASSVLFIISPDSVQSKWTKAELLRAGELEKPVLPLVLRPISAASDQLAMNSIKIGDKVLSELHALNFHRFGYDVEFSKLVNDMKRLQIPTTD